MSTKRFFTLIELLAVIVVILTLVSLLYPTLRKSRLLALQAGCVSNLKQISILEQLYSGNNRNWVTPTSPSPAGPRSDDNDMSTLWISWDDFLGIGYDGRNLVVSEVNLQVYGTPASYPTPTATSWIYKCPLDKRSHDDLVARSYAINVEIALSKRDGHYPGTNLTGIANPGQTILFAERIADARPVTRNDDRGSVIGNDEYAGFSDGNRPGATTKVTTCDLDASGWISNHPRPGDLPWLFVDGHVELRNRVYFQNFLVQ